MSTCNFIALCLVIITITLCQCEAAKHSRSRKLNIDCSIFNNTRKYGDEICGTDGKTYKNSRVLECENEKKNMDVATAYTGSCISGKKCKENLHYSPICDENYRTWSNIDSYHCNSPDEDTSSEVTDGVCDDIDYCNQTESYDKYGLNPVCASNGLTFENVAQVKCLMQYDNTNLRVIRDGGCRTSFIRKLYDKSTICLIAHSRYEWNPVCASDGNTYPNPFILLCDKPRLHIVFHGECNSAIHMACKIAGIDLNMKSKLTESDSNFDENDQVCGNNGRSYTSIHHLNCSRYYNKYLAMKHKGPCRGPNDNPCGDVTCEESRFPICATNGITYFSEEAMWCASRRSRRKIVYKHDGPC